MRVLGRAQAAIGDRDSKTAIFGAPVGAYVKGRPLYTNWYHPVLGAQVHSITSADGRGPRARGLERDPCHLRPAGAR